MKKYLFNLCLWFSLLTVLLSCNKDLSVSIDVNKVNNDKVIIDYKLSKASFITIVNTQQVVKYSKYLEKGNGSLEIDISTYDKGEYFGKIQVSNGTFLAFIKD